MNHIKILGASGSRATQANTTCIQVGSHTLIDAGNIMQSLGEEALEIERLFISHSHLDHIFDSAFLVDNFFALRTKSLEIYALPETIHALKTHFFNNTIWPDFAHIYLPNSHTPAIVYKEISLYESYVIEEGITLTPIPANHTVACCGYLIEKAGNGILFTSDTFCNDALWEFINHHEGIQALIIDVSLPNELEEIAVESKHLTPYFLEQELKKLTCKSIKLYINHLKPSYEDAVCRQLSALEIDGSAILRENDSLLFDGTLIPAPSHDTEKERIKKLNDIGIALSSASSLDELLKRIVNEAKALTHADGGTLYIAKENALHFKIVHTDSLNIHLEEDEKVDTWQPLPLYLSNGTPNTTLVATTCALEHRSINIPDVYEAQGFSFEGTRFFDASTGYRSVSMLVIPLTNHENDIIGVLQLINKKHPQTGTITTFNAEDEELALSLASQAAIAMTNTVLIQDLENLLEAFLKSIIVAMSKKSPHTAGHIKRMVKLSTLFARSIHDDAHFFKGKSFGENELKQINFAALMHDIGKLATPESIIEKATKLHTMFDRIELIEQRILSLKNALHVKMLQEHIALMRQDSLEALNVCEQKYKTTLEEIESYWQLILKSNSGRITLCAEEIARLHYISTLFWEIDGVRYFILNENETYNLSVIAGTLTHEEREIINLHAKHSVDILQKLPFPKKYQEIPNISGNHHEKLNGTGYPQGLLEEAISFEARILAIADVFEALTASDRPYKEGMSLNAAMRVLYEMARANELDASLVKFFYTSGVYLEYARQFLPTSAIDAVTIDFSTL